MVKAGKQSIEIFVKDRNGEPVSTAKVVAVNLDTGKRLELDLDKKGRCTAELAVGNFKIIVNKSGYREKLTEFEVSETSPGAIEVTLTEEEETATQKSVTVIVQNKNVTPLNADEVTAFNTKTQDSVTFSPQGEGLFTADLEVGNYTLTAKKAGYQDRSIPLAVPAGPPDSIAETLTLEEKVMAKKIKITVRNINNELLTDATVTAFNKGTKEIKTLSFLGDSYDDELDEGNYQLTVTRPGYQDKSSELEVSSTSPDTIAVPFVLAEPEIGVEALLNELEKKAEHSIEPTISTTEAEQGIGLFSVVNLILAGKSEFNGGGVKKTDVLGVLKLFYGLQDKSLANKIVTSNSQNLWDKLEAIKFPELAMDLDRLQGDLDFIYREAKRQFNLGTNNSVLGNTQFPALFKKYVEQGSDPLLSINLATASQSEFFDKEKLEKANDLLRDLKETIVEIVRSLSKYGTSATSRVNREWGIFLTKALLVLGEVANQRISDDQDEKNTWSVVAALTDQNRENIIPYVSLGQHGASLLKHAVAIYSNQNKFREDKDLKDLFQAGVNQEEFWTTKIRSSARIVKRYPLTNWS